MAGTATNSLAFGGVGQKPGPLDGIWLRGPYLHDHSVPTIRDLLNPPSQRPQNFYTGDDLIDTQNVGFVSTVAHDMGRQFQPSSGNTNSGHLYGSDLPAPEKSALLEYLKTL
jgi:hypothetical protein